MSENVFYAVVHFDTVFVTRLAYYVDTPERFDGTLQQFICLQTDDQLVFLVDISRFVGSDGRYGNIIQCADTVVCSLFSQCFEAAVPYGFCAFGRSFEERCISVVRSDVMTYEISYVDFAAPKTVFKDLV